MVEATPENLSTKKSSRARFEPAKPAALKTGSWARGWEEQALGGNCVPPVHSVRTGCRRHAMKIGAGALVKLRRRFIRDSSCPWVEGCFTKLC